MPKCVTTTCQLRQQANNSRLNNFFSQVQDWSSTLGQRNTSHFILLYITLLCCVFTCLWKTLAFKTNKQQCKMLPHTTFSHHQSLLLFVFVALFSNEIVCLAADCRVLDVGVSHQHTNTKKLKRQRQPSRHRAGCSVFDSN